MPNPKRLKFPPSAPQVPPQNHYLPNEPIFPANRHKIQPLTPSGNEPATLNQSRPFRSRKRRKSRRIRRRFRHVSQIKMRNSFIPSMAPTVHYSLPKEKSL